MFNRSKNQSPNPSKLKLSDRKRRIYDFLRENPVGVLSTVSPNGDPHGVVIYYSIDEEGIVSFLTKSRTRKYDYIKHHNRVMLTVFEPKTQSTVQIVGLAKEITDAIEINEVANKTLGASIKTSDSGLPPITKLEAGDVVAFRIKPVQMRMAVYAKPDQGEYTELFESIESFDFNDDDS